jgi:alkylated DNA repair protein (DNA oxidative demethylase)
MTTPWGAAISIAMTDCGDVGWLSDRYDRVDPESGGLWPAMPTCFSLLAIGAADHAGYQGFIPDACLINR